MPVACSEGAGVKAYQPGVSSITADPLPYHQNSSFVVYNDGLTDGVYVIRVAVDDPLAVTWINVTPAAFVLKPGEMRKIDFNLNISPENAKPGTYHVRFMPTLLPARVEPYIEKFATYIAYLDSFNLTIEVPVTAAGFSVTEENAAKTPVSFTANAPEERVNLVQYASPQEGNASVTEIDRAVRINIRETAKAGDQVPVTLSIFEGLSDRGIELMALSPDGIFYPVTDNVFTFNQPGKWGVVAVVGDQIILGRPITVETGGAMLAMPGLDTILAAASLLLLVSIIPIWLFSRRKSSDPYDDVSFKAYVIKKYIDKFDKPRLSTAVSQVEDEYNRLVTEGVNGDRERAQASISELRALASMQ